MAPSFVEVDGRPAALPLARTVLPLISDVHGDGGVRGNDGVGR